MDSLREIFGTAGFVIEAVGVIVMVAGFIISTLWFVGRLRREGRLNAYQEFRRDLARSIILGLEFLVAGDIIRTITVDQTIQGAAVLAIIVLIRILLNLTLELEIEGRWPWQQGERPERKT